MSAEPETTTTGMPVLRSSSRRRSVASPWRWTSRKTSDGRSAATASRASSSVPAEPAVLDDERVLDTLKQLQYRLHVASEDAYGISPPTGVEPVHAELAAALAGARDATAELVEALEEDGLDAALFYLHEWRGALFRVRLARLRLTVPAPPAPQVDQNP